MTLTQRLKKLFVINRSLQHKRKHRRKVHAESRAGKRALCGVMTHMRRVESEREFRLVPAGHPDVNCRRCRVAASRNWRNG